MNIVDPILFQCRYHAPAAAICSPGSGLNLVSYARLERLINNASRLALESGLKRGDIVAISVNDGILHAALSLGLMRIGVVTVVARQMMPAQLRIAAIVSDRAIPAPAFGPKVILVDGGLAEGDGLPLEDARLYVSDENEVCRILLTTGTTGDPKAVALTHRILARRIGRHPYVFGNRLARCARICSDFGLGSSLGFQFLISTLWSGGTIVINGEDPQFTIQSLDLYRVQALIGSQVSLAASAKFYETHPQFQPGFEVVMTAGSALAPVLAQRVSARVCNNIVTVYGATEMSVIATALAQALESTPGAVGYVTPDMDVEIVDDGDARVANGVEGRVRIRGPYGVAGYYGMSNSMQGPFRDGWFYAGDVGILDADGLLSITGREASVVNVGGDKIKPEQVEATIMTFPGVEQAGVFAVRNELGIDQLWAAIVVSAAVDEKALAAHCETWFAAAFVPVGFIPVQSLPRNEMGKLQRDQLAIVAGKTPS